MNDGGCILPSGLREGCTCEEALNFNANAEIYDGSCIYPEGGCTYKAAWNYDTSAVKDDGSCAFGQLEELGEELHMLRQLVAEKGQKIVELESSNQEKDQIIGDRDKTIEEKDKKIENLGEELMVAKQEKEEEIAGVEDRLSATEHILEGCQSDRREAQNERQRFQILLQQCQSVRPSNESQENGRSFGNETSFQLSTHVVEFSRREHTVKLPKNSIEVVLTRSPSNSLGKPDGTIGTAVQSIDKTAQADIDFSPVDAFLIWEPGETQKTIPICIKTTPSFGKHVQFDLAVTPFISPGDAINIISTRNSTTTVHIVGREPVQDSSDLISRQQRIWWAHWSKRLQKGFRP